jgi:hypothetical protein
MAEICLKCYNDRAAEDKHKKLDVDDVVLEYDLCEFCGKIKPCIMVIKQREPSLFERMWGIM